MNELLVEKSLVTTLITLRHGDYDKGTKHLSIDGKQQIKTITDQLMPFIGTKSVIILSSTAIMAVESAIIMANKLGINFKKHKVLWSDINHHMNIAEVYRLVQSHLESTEVLILVTHHDYVKYFPQYFARQQLGAHHSSYPIDRGSAWVLNWEDEITLKLINSK